MDQKHNFRVSSGGEKQRDLSVGGSCLQRVLKSTLKIKLQKAVYFNRTCCGYFPFPHNNQNTDIPDALKHGGEKAALNALLK